MRSKFREFAYRLTLVHLILVRGFRPALGGAPDVQSMGTGAGLGALPSAINLMFASLTISPAIVATIVAPEQTFTLPGIPASCYVGVTEDGAPTANCPPTTARRTAANTVGIRWVNPTAAGITPAVTTTYRFLIAALPPT